MIVEACMTRSNGVFKRTRERKAAEPHVLGTGSEDEFGQRLAS